MLVLPLAAAPPHLIERATPHGVVVGYQDTPLQPWTGNKYHVLDPARPVPPTVVTSAPARVGAPPSDAIVLFDGTNLDKWKPASWKILDGSVQVADHESLETRDAFGDCQLHVEWLAPADPGDNFMNRGNSGVLMMGLYEIQIFDSWPGHRRQIYPDGQAASIYGQTPPLVNACRPPGKWQTYDIVLRPPCSSMTSSSKKHVSPCSTTVFSCIGTRRSWARWRTARFCPTDRIRPSCR